MSLFLDVKNILVKFIGKNADTVLNNFDNASDFPKDFLEESIDFISNLIGIEETLRLFKPIARKYHIKI